MLLSAPGSWAGWDPRPGGSTTDRAGAAASSRWPLRPPASPAASPGSKKGSKKGCAQPCLARAGGPALRKHARALPSSRHRGRSSGGSAAPPPKCSALWGQGSGQRSATLLPPPRGLVRDLSIAYPASEINPDGGREDGREGEGGSCPCEVTQRPPPLMRLILTFVRL